MSTSFISAIGDQLKRLSWPIRAVAGLVPAGTEINPRGPGNTAAETSGSPEESSVQTRALHKATMLANHRIKVRDYAYESTLPPVRSYRPPRAKGPQPLRRKRQEWGMEMDEEHDRAMAVLPTASTMLANHRIKVRDYAYESTLPPVRSYRPPRAKGPQPLKRKRQEWGMEMDEEHDHAMAVLPTALVDVRSSGWGHESRTMKKRKLLERSPIKPHEYSRIHSPTGHRDVSHITTTLEASSSVPTHVGRSTTSLWTESKCSATSKNVATGTTGHVDVSLHGPIQEPECSIDTPHITPETPSVLVPIVNTVARGPSLSPSHILTPPPVSRIPGLRQVHLVRSPLQASVPRQLPAGASSSPSPPAPRYHLRDRKMIKPPTPPSVRQPANLRASTTSLPRRRTRKTRSSVSKGATENTHKINQSPSKPALRRSARRVGLRS